MKTYVCLKVISQKIEKMYDKCTNEGVKHISYFYLCAKHTHTHKFTKFKLLIIRIGQ